MFLSMKYNEDLPVSDHINKYHPVDPCPVVAPLGIRTTGSRRLFLHSFYLGRVTSCARAYFGTIPLEAESPRACWNQQFPRGTVQFLCDVFLSHVVPDSGSHECINGWWVAVNGFSTGVDRRQACTCFRTASPCLSGRCSPGG